MHPKAEKPKYSVQDLSEFLDHEPIENLSLDITNTFYFRDFYKFVGINGGGGFGRVVKVIEKSSGDAKAIKLIKISQQSNCDIEAILSEAKILQTLRHSNILNVFDVHQSKKYIFIVTEQLDGGSLHDLLEKKGKLSDEKASQLMTNLLKGIEFIHLQDYMHRDLKPSNIMFEYYGHLDSIKIVDFGLGSKLNHYHSAAGTPYFMAPEQYKDNHNFNCLVDIWACGIIMYMILTGDHPNRFSPQSIHKNDNPIWVFTDDFSELAKNFFLNLCQVDPSKRYSVFDALEHPWITRRYDDPIPKPLELRMELSVMKHKIKKIIQLFGILYKLCDKSFISQMLQPKPIEKQKSIELVKDDTPFEIAKDVVMLSSKLRSSSQSKMSRKIYRNQFNNRKTIFDEEDIKYMVCIISRLIKRESSQK